ncbi:hypothetical protein LQZ18_09585 [Lachnospiraceae bacterium ZAX-1]
MHKKFLPTFFGILLTFLIAIGAWALTYKLLAQSEDSLFAKHGTVNNATPDSIASNSDEQRLSVSEMATVLQNWNSVWNAYLHNPENGQINMERAIQIAENGLSTINMQEILPTEFYKEDVKTGAMLYENRETNNVDAVLAPGYSYWAVTLGQLYAIASR